MRENGSNETPETPGLPGLSEKNREYLLQVAREAVARSVKRQPQPTLEYSDPVLSGRCGAFVTLKIHGDLRGCIGSIISDRPLPETIADMAVKSASTDPRFPPIGPSELDKLEFDISILGPLIKVNNISEIVIGRDGLVIEQGYRRGLLLPQVATENGMDIETFLGHTCIKAGLPSETWRQGAEIYRFAAEVF